MNTTNNRRRRDSVARIESAFMELLQTKELGNISVSELCKNCGLNRSTFYANFIDIYDLADKMRIHLEEEVSRLWESEERQGFNSHDYLKLFRHIQENQLFYRTYFRLGYADQLQIGLYRYDTKLAAQHFGGQYIDYHIEFFRCGLNAIIKMWLEGGCRESPEEMKTIIESEYHGRDMKP